MVEAMEAGVLAGYPVVDVEARVVDGKEHPVDSSELAFKLAAREAFRECMRNAKPVLLEPVCNLTVFVDEQYLGAVLSDLSSKRGKVSGQNPIGGGILEIKAQVPQAELMRYAIDLKALTAGTGSFEIEFDHYSPISGRIAEDVIKAPRLPRRKRRRSSWPADAPLARYAPWPAALRGSRARAAPQLQNDAIGQEEVRPPRSPTR